MAEQTHRRVAVVAIGVVGYLVIMGLAAFGSREPDSIADRLRTWVLSAPAQNIGLPSAAMASFALWMTYSLEKASSAGQFNLALPRMALKKFSRCG